MKKRILIIGLIIVLLAAGGFVYWQTSRDDRGPQRLTLHGNVDIRTSNLAFDGQALVTSMRVQEGAHVKQGQLLATLDTARLLAQLKQQQAQIQAQQAVVNRLKAGTRPEEILQAKAHLASAQARLDNVKQKLGRLDQTVASGATSQQMLDDTQAQVHVEQALTEEAKQGLVLANKGPRQEDIDQAQAQLKAAQAQVGVLQVQLDHTKLLAPSDGVIRSRLLEPGDYASPGRAVYTLALTDPKWVRAYVSEPQLGRVRFGAKAWVTTDSFPGRLLDGWVGFISPVAEFTPKAVQTDDLRTQLVYEVRVYVKDPEDQLRMGMPATVTIDEQSKPDASPVTPASEPTSTLAPREDRP